MRENVTQGACPLAPALTTRALNHPASFPCSVPPAAGRAELREGVARGAGEPVTTFWD